MFRVLVVCAAALMVSPMAHGRSRVVRHPGGTWQSPTCERFSGLANLRAFVTFDETLPRNGEEFDILVPYGTALNTAAVANILYATSADGGIHRSTDAGCTWNELARLRELERQWEVGIVTTHASPVYIHTPYDLIQLHGNTVTPIPIPGDIVMLAVSPSDPLRLRSIARNGVARESADGGRNWTKLGTFGTGKVDVAVVDPNSFDHLVAAANGVTYSSTDGGRSWASGFAPGGEVFDIAFSPVDPRNVWMTARNGPLAPGVLQNIYLSEDGGKTFRIPNPSVQCYASSIAPHPTMATVAAIGCYGIRVTDSSGAELRLPQYGRAYAPVYSPIGTLYYLTEFVESR